ncbi:hypothetical protein LWI28_007795 [Acer negundo]|uniref:Uncharacterized protein n=1 Tax=Acer negundo TaxID=4023 RepID=A0AAD5NI37_ACENE|nr:hypothetical protein LWI28_007795 [Acer negundo]KAK4837186.1 hypothetical protein QYF36_003484 [Acer negundo]
MATLEEEGGREVVGKERSRDRWRLEVRFHGGDLRLMEGEVGKSTFSAQLSFASAAMDFQVGLLDIDICGPSIPKMLGLERQDIHRSNPGWSIVCVEFNLHNIKQFLKDVYWGEIDCLVVDAPLGNLR